MGSERKRFVNILKATVVKGGLRRFFAGYDTAGQNEGMRRRHACIIRCNWAHVYITRRARAGSQRLTTKDTNTKTKDTNTNPKTTNLHY